VKMTIKRATDVLLAGALLVALAPLMAVVWLLVRTRMGKPVFFRQRRPGLGGQLFELIKFRTMTNPDSKDATQPDERRLTMFGRRLRSASLDELPELWNVLRGDMSLVGPRPLLAEYLPRYSPRQARRHDVKPGVTGWAQVNGRNSTNWEERFELDLWYVEHWSLALDAKILWLTFWNVVARRGITHEGHATMPEFSGQVTRGAGEGPPQRRAREPRES
jgi:lipopolysaccharide/colanic/teichoic acid biosynthesis glycosyltransferase